MIFALLLALALPAAAQSPMPYSGDAPAPAPAPPPAASTDTVAASTVTVVAVSTAGVHVAGGEKPKLARPIHAVIHPEAKDWQPLSLRAGGDPGQAESKAVLRVVRAKGKLKGAASKAKSIARLRKVGEDRWLVVSVFPKALEKKRVHFEVKFRLVEGFIEDAKASMVTIVDRRTGGWGLDADELDARGVEFEEDSPASGAITVSALDPRLSKNAVNAGTLKLATFADEDVGTADVSWSAKGLKASR